MRIAKRAYTWACERTSSPLAPLWLALIFLLEAVLFVPMDALLMLFCMQDPNRRFLYAIAATLSSLIVGIIGYLIGFLLWDVVGEFVTTHILSQAFFDRLVAHYNQYESLAVFFGSLLPIPFKAVTISAGFCQISPVGFLTALVSARALRFFLIAGFTQRWGEQIKAFIDRHFNSLLIAIGVKVLGTMAFFWILGSE